ncbi:hypothetical protein A2Z22_03800 [Candidatus Woesebacteria bacterium RBG_16_34_12]|uniref:Uncharacterized protein n=1 Tax=Candidatus Woesebacteria bacterium RBG_16_34_12 TaxID=1802480 RepID=A0A1F7X7B8_9BACT|nr:MAG: hypothetical protein A2Z22_03800 [Candidatus Woesebacteria bacterium RBG_16_34_12]
MEIMRPNKFPGICETCSEASNTILEISKDIKSIRPPTELISLELRCKRKFYPRNRMSMHISGRCKKIEDSSEELVDLILKPVSVQCLGLKK